MLLKELREAFDAESQEIHQERLLLSAAVPVGPDNVKGGYDVPAVASYLDFINLVGIFIAFLNFFNSNFTISDGL